MIGCPKMFTTNGQFQKIFIPYHGRPFRILRARGGSLNWKSEGMGDTYDGNSEGMGGF